ncbi:hypothetical protein [Staphylococcus haemolyticus]|uniref:hypothetical protein n=1 Tax=Staphylococcus haemolyticus TaxID=1283 RepID=UPI00290486C7|nr:hypothetical protein [Staphylococcus haemolyticus]MDU0485407.1 hypothetical protein [Staphylococcus haemolyticus]
MKIEDVLNYLDLIPTPQSYESMDIDTAKKHVFNAQEEVNDVLIKYPTVDISPRMVALQTIYNLEGEEEGTAMMRRQGITDYTVKDVKAVLDKDVISPSVFAIIEALAEQQVNNNLRVGRLI